MVWARTTECSYEGRVIGIDEALRIRELKKARGQLGFQCSVCKQRMIAHAGGADGKKHFEHAPGQDKAERRAHHPC